MRAFEFNQEGIAKVVTGFESCNLLNPDNQSNWTGIADNLWVPDDATFGFIDLEGTEYWCD